MKYFILSLALGLGLTSFAPNAPGAATRTGKLVLPSASNFSNTLILQADPGSSKMPASVFRAQKFCRAETVEDFPYDAPFSIVSATVYFSGTNFRYVEKGTITSGSLEPVEALKSRCVPGSIVIFDDVKVVGPDKLVRPIAGLTLMLH